jgi:RNase P/RNase MRP subunit POP5
MKPLKPSMRLKSRYILFEIISKKKIDLEDFESEYMGICKEFLGKLAFSEANIKMFKKLYSKKKSIIRVNYGYVKPAMVCLGLIKKVKKEDIVIRTIRICGSIKKAKLILGVNDNGRK